MRLARASHRTATLSPQSEHGSPANQPDFRGSTTTSRTCPAPKIREQRRVQNPRASFPISMHSRAPALSLIHINGERCVLSDYAASISIQRPNFPRPAIEGAEQCTNAFWWRSTEAILRTRPLKEAIQLAKEHHSMLRLFHVVDLSLAYSSVEAPYMVEYQKALESAGQKVVADCSAPAHSAGIEFDTKWVTVVGKHIYDAIEEEPEQWPADLVVIGTHGRRGIQRLFLGSIAEGLARLANKPVLLIRGDRGT